MKKAILASLLFLFGLTFAHAQIAQTRQPLNLEKQLEKAVLNAVKKRQDWQTVAYVSSIIEAGNKVDGCLLSSIAADSAYMHKLGDEELGILAETLDQADFSKASGCGVQMALVSADALKQIPFSAEAADFRLGLFYETSLVRLCRQKEISPIVIKWAFEQLKEAADFHFSDVEGASWAALILLTVSGDEKPVFDRLDFEERLEEIIPQFDWLKDARADYLTRFGKSDGKWSKSNQSVLLSLFAQADNFFSLRDDESFLESFAATGGFNSWVRKEGEERFSADGEIFYLHHPTPGTDGKGNFADSVNGRKHQILSELIWALSTSYSTRPQFAEASSLMESFVRKYIAIDGQGFKHYLYIPLQAMRAGRTLLNNLDARGWQAEAGLQEELYRNLRDKYGIYVAVAYMQGASELAAEWHALGGVFSAVGEGFKMVGKGVARVWIKYVPKRSRVILRKNIVDPIRKLRGKPARPHVISGRRIRIDIAQEKRALEIQYRLGDLTREEFLRAWQMLEEEQARELALHGLAH